MTVADNQQGLCPNCQLEGNVGSPCGERGCQNRGYHFIPRSYFDKLMESGRSRLEPLIGQVVGDYLPLSHASHPQTA